MEARIRRVSPNDAAVLCDVMARSLEHFHAESLGSETRSQLGAGVLEPRLADEFEAPPTPDWRAWAVELGGVARGFCRTGPSGDGDLEVTTVAEIHGLYIEPEFTSSGLGRSLLTWCVDDLRDRGYLAVTAWSPESARNARHFLEAGGFQVDGPPCLRAFEGAQVSQMRYRLKLKRPSFS